MLDLDEEEELDFDIDLDEEDTGMAEDALVSVSDGHPED